MAKHTASAAAPAPRTPTDFDPSKVTFTPLTRSMVHFEIDKPVHVEITSGMEISKAKVKETKDGKPKREPMTVCDVVNLETGELMVMGCSAVIKSTLDEKYKDAGYIGKQFRIIKRAKVEGRNYYRYSIDEINA